MPLVLRSRFNIFLVLTIIFFSVALIQVARADIFDVPPTHITTCGEMLLPGTYTLDNDITSTTTCFIISRDGVEIEGNGHTITASGTVPLAIDARNYISPDGGNGYTNTILSNINFTGFTTLIDASGNTSTSSYAGQGGDIYLYYVGATSTNITTLGGTTTATGYGGLGGNISITDTALDLSSTTISTTGGVGTTGTNTAGGLSLTYTSITHDNITLSPLNYLQQSTSIIHHIR